MTLSTQRSCQATLPGHSSAATQIKSHGADTLITADTDGVLQIWSGRQMDRPVHRINAYQDRAIIALDVRYPAVLTCASSCGKGSCGGDDKVSVWDMRSGERVCELEGGDSDRWRPEREVLWAGRLPRVGMAVVVAQWEGEIALEVSAFIRMLVIVRWRWLSSCRCGNMGFRKLLFRCDSFVLLFKSYMLGSKQVGYEDLATEGERCSLALGARRRKNFNL